MTALYGALAACVAGALVSVLTAGRWGRAGGFALLGIGGVFALAAAAEVLRGGAVAWAIGEPVAHVVFRIDGLAAFFLAILGAVALLVAAYALGPRAHDERGSGRTASASACAILFASLLACTAADVLLFVFAWELLALTFYWAIAYAGTDPQAARAGYVTIAVTHVAGAGIVVALLLLAHAAGSFAVDDAVRAGAALSPAFAGAVLMLLLFGFGAKFGLPPLQGWMPYGYRAAPSTVAALMAGGALNAGFYGVARFIVAFPHAPLWFAIVAIVLGAIAALSGIAWAAAQRDIVRLAAFSSVENGGVILVAFGVAVAAATLHLPLLAGFAVASAFVQIAAHAFAKTTLFLSACSIADATRTTSLDELGGLARALPLTTAAVLASGMSLAALPPLAGFTGEWLVLETLMQAFRTANVACEVTFAIAGALVGVAAGIAVVTFTKLIGIGMLGAARSTAAAAAGAQRRSGFRGAALVAGCCAIAGAGLCAAPLLRAVAPGIDGLAGVPAVAAMTGTFPLLTPSFAGFSSVSPGGLLAMVSGFTLLFWLIARAFSRPADRTGAVWTSGETYRAWTQYTGTGYANPTRVILDAGLRTVREVAAQRPTYRSDVRPFFDLPFYRAIAAPFLRISDAVRKTQSGAIAAYLSYILAFTILMLLLFPSIRHW